MTPESGDTTECQGVRIDATFVTKLNLADFQNAVLMLRELSITNASEEDASEPPHISRRLQHLRRWSHEEVNEVFA